VPAKAPPACLAEEPPELAQGTIKGIIKWYDDLCYHNDATGHWVVPATSDLFATGNIATFDWPRMLHDEAVFSHEKNIVRIVPTYFLDEVDVNHFDRPRLDFVVYFDDGTSVRYHPKASMKDKALVEAIRLRRRRLAKLRTNNRRDWA
jgi:hypothetical protein